MNTLEERTITRARGRTAVALCVLLLANAPLLRGAFEETSIGGRVSAMGGIGVALTDDANSIYHNPAGLALIDQAQFSAQYSKLYAGLDDGSNLGYSFLGIAQPLKKTRDHGTVGFGWLRLELAGLYQENTFILSYARNLVSPDISVGVNLKYLSLAYGSDEYTKNALDTNGNALNHPDRLFETYGTSQGALDVDAGIRYRLADNYYLGFVIANLLEPNIALETSVNAAVPRTYKLGIAHFAGTYALTVDGLIKKLNKNTDWELSAGAEKRFKSKFALRGGMVFGSRDISQGALGVGYRFDSLDVDYAILYPFSGVKDTLGTHRISMAFRFGPVVRTSDERSSARYDKEHEQRVAAEKDLAAARKEIETLRAQLKANLEKPVAVSQPAAPAGKAETRIPSKTAPALSKVNGEDLEKEMAQYRKNADSMTLPKRVVALKSIVEKYKGKTDVTAVMQEYTTENGELAAQEKYYRDSLTYYRRMVMQGISREEKTDLLKRIVKKYDAIGIDVSAAQRELEGISIKNK